MRVLQITDDIPQFAVGGSARIAWETCLGLACRGHEVSLLTATPNGTIDPELNRVHLYAIPNRGRRWAHYCSVFSNRRAAEVLAVIKAVKPDIIHAHGIAWQIGYRWITGARKLGYPVVYTAHGVMHVSYGKVTGREPHLWLQDLKRARWTMNPLRNRLIRTALNQSQAILCVSDVLRNYLQHYGFKNQRTLHNGIDLRFWQPIASRQTARERLGLPPDVIMFLLAGRIGHDKGSTAIVHALPAGAHLIVAGVVDPSLFAALHGRVHFFPNQTAEQMRLLYAACDVALVLSIYLDPFPTICLEAMACERPVIATTHGGAKEAVADHRTGWLVDPLDEVALKRRLEWCIDNANLLPSVGMEGRRHIARQFAQTTYLDRLLAAYGSCRHFRS